MSAVRYRDFIGPVDYMKHGIEKDIKKEYGKKT